MTADLGEGGRSNMPVQLEWEALQEKRRREKEKVPPPPLEKVTYPISRTSQLIIDEGLPQPIKPVSWATLEREVLRQRLAGETRPKPTPTPTPSPIETKGYYVSEETGRHVLTDPTLIRQSHVELQEQGYMTLGGKRVRGLQIEWEPHGVPSKFPWARRREAMRTRWKKGLRETYPTSRYTLRFKDDKAEISLLPKVAEAEWKEETRKQYPRDRYMIMWRDFGKALIYEKAARGQPLMFFDPRATGLEPKAVEAWETIQAERGKAQRIAPLFRGVSKRRVSLAEFNIPYNVKELTKELVSWKEELRQQYPASEYRIKFLNGKAQISLLPKVAEDRWRKELLGQYPTSEYRIEWKDGEALIYGLEPPKPKELTWTEQFWREMTKPRLKGYGEPDSKILGGPIGGTYATQVTGFPLMLGEATVGEFEEHVLKKHTIRSDLMTPEQLALSYGVIAVIAGVKFGPKISKHFKFSHVAKTVKSFKTKLPSWKGSRVDVWLAKHSKLYYGKTRGVSPQEVGLKPFEMVTTMKGETLPKIGLGDIQATDIYWKMLQSPRTGGVMIGKAPILTKGIQTYTFEWVMRGDQLIPRFRPERAQSYMPSQKATSKSIAQMFKPVKLKPYTPIYQRGLLPFVTQKQVTRMGIVPYRAPYVGGRTFATVSPKIIGPTLAMLGVGLAKKLRFIPKILEWQPTLAREREKFRTITLERVKQKQKQVLIFPRLKMLQLKHQPLRQLYRPKLRKKEAVVPKMPTIVMTKQERKQLTILKPLQIPRHVYPPNLVPPTLTPPIIPPFRPPTRDPDVSRAVAGLHGEWFRREHAIKTPKEVLRAFGIWKPVRRRVKRKKSRKKGGVLSWF